MRFILLVDSDMYSTASFQGKNALRTLSGFSTEESAHLVWAFPPCKIRFNGQKRVHFKQQHSQCNTTLFYLTAKTPNLPILYIHSQNSVIVNSYNTFNDWMKTIKSKIFFFCLFSYMVCFLRWYMGSVPQGACSTSEHMAKTCSSSLCVHCIAWTCSTSSLWR